MSEMSVSEIENEIFMDRLGQVYPYKLLKLFNSTNYNKKFYLSGSSAMNIFLGNLEAVRNSDMDIFTSYPYHLDIREPLEKLGYIYSDYPDSEDYFEIGKYTMKIHKYTRGPEMSTRYPKKIDIVWATSGCDNILDLIDKTFDLSISQISFEFYTNKLHVPYPHLARLNKSLILKRGNNTESRIIKYTNNYGTEFLSSVY